MDFNKFQQDGAQFQAKAVLAEIQGLIDEDVANTLQISRWENCREQGYVISQRLNKVGVAQLNIAWFEHRNSDQICAVRWLQNTINMPTIDSAEFGDVYKDKFDVSFESGWREYSKMSEWIIDQFKEYMEANNV